MPMPRLHLGWMNDGLYIIDRPPTPSVADISQQERGECPKTIAACGTDLELAEHLVTAWNAVLDSRQKRSA